MDTKNIICEKGLEVTLEKPVPGQHTSWSPSAVNEHRLSIDLGQDKSLDIEFFQLEDGAPIEVSLSISAASGIYQDLVMVKAQSDLEKGPNDIELLVWKDPEDENYTDQVTIPLTREFDEEAE